MTMATVDVTRLRELHAAATAGEWHVTPLSFDYGIFSRAHECIALVDGAEPYKRGDNAAYIAAVHNALPAVLDALEQAQRERDAAKDALAATGRVITGYVDKLAAATAERDDYMAKFRVMEREWQLERGQVATVTAERDAALAELAQVRTQANAEWQEEHAARIVLGEQLKAAVQEREALRLELDCID